MKLTVVCLGSFLLFAAVPCLAQSQDSGSSSASSAKPAAPPANGQTNVSTDKANASQDKTNAPADKTSIPTAEKKKPKKVWTNDEIESVKGGISVVGDDDPSSGYKVVRKTASSTNANETRKMQIENYRCQIQELQSDIDAVDERIAQLKNFKADNSTPSGGINPYQGYNMVPLEDQIKQLEGQKKQLNAKIEDVENDARKNGIESGDLR